MTTMMPDTVLLKMGGNDAIVPVGDVPTYKSPDLWILNRIQLEGHRRMELMFTLPSRDGEKLIKIPVSWMPINLAELYDRTWLLRSPKFIAQISNKRLVVIKTEAVLAYMKLNPDAQVEVDRAKGIINETGSSDSANISISTGVSSQGNTARIQQQQQLPPLLESIVAGSLSMGNDQLRNYIRNTVNTREELSLLRSRLPGREVVIDDILKDVA